MINKALKVTLAQINPVVGDIDANTRKMIQIIKKHQDTDLIIFPEMCITGYPLMDHIYDPLIQDQNSEAIRTLQDLRTRSTIIFGTFTHTEDSKELVHPFHNSALVIKRGIIKDVINKRLLPDYDIFNERRYFVFDDNYTPTLINDINVGILICEDLWDDNYESKVAKNLVLNGAELLVVINASPFHIGKFELRKRIVSLKAKNLSVPIIYLNMIGGLDEIVYDGRSFICDDKGKLIHILKAFEEETSDFVLTTNEIDQVQYKPNWKEEVIDALKINLNDYYYKSNIFKGIVLGLSGGIDSAFTALICAKAIGADKVHAIMMPTRFTSQESIELAKKLCENIGINYKIHQIDFLFKMFEKNIQENLGSVDFDTADENLQARIRAIILMYYSNKFNWLLVSTGNKSEIGVGYCTLYGDTNGGKNVPGDLFKVQIYELCEWINRNNEIIPRGIIERPPTAELRENQKDSDSLPPYEVLDVILEDIIQNGIGGNIQNLLDKGIKKETITKVRKLYLNSEYKRRQLVQTIKVSESAFGIGRRYPVLKNFRLERID